MVLDKVSLLILINAGTLISIITFGWKIIKFINTIEFKTNLMWDDYESRTERARNGDFG
jgi:hypothetical protein